MTKAPLLHQHKGVSPLGTSRRRDGLTVHHVGDAAIDGHASKQPTANVAVGDDAYQSPGLVDHHHRLAAILRDGFERVTDRCARGNQPSALETHEAEQPETAMIKG
jgi:hypothetical protein